MSRIKSQTEVVDLQQLRCRHVTRRDKEMTLRQADERNELMCKYTTVREDSSSKPESRLRHVLHVVTVVIRVRTTVLVLMSVHRDASVTSQKLRELTG